MHTLRVLPGPGFLQKASSLFVLPSLFQVRKNPCFLNLTGDFFFFCGFGFFGRSVEF